MKFFGCKSIYILKLSFYRGGVMNVSFVYSGTWISYFILLWFYPHEIKPRFLCITLLQIQFFKHVDSTLMKLCCVNIIRISMQHCIEWYHPNSHNKCSYINIREHLPTMIWFVFDHHILIVIASFSIVVWSRIFRRYQTFFLS